MTNNHFDLIEAHFPNYSFSSRIRMNDILCRASGNEEISHDDEKTVCDMVVQLRIDDRDFIGASDEACIKYLLATDTLKLLDDVAECIMKGG